MNSQLFFSSVLFGRTIGYLALSILVIAPTSVQGQAPINQGSQIVNPVPVQQSGQVYGQPYQIQQQPIQQQPYPIIRQPYPIIQQPYPNYPQTIPQTVPQNQQPATPSDPNSLRQSLTTSQQELAKTRRQLKYVLDKNRKLENDIKSSKQQPTRPNRPNRPNQPDASIEQRLAELRQSMTEKAETQISGLNSQLETAQQELRTSLNELEQQKTVVSDLQSQVSSLRQSNQSLQQSSQSTDNQQLIDLRNQVQQFETANQSRTEQMNNLQQSLQSRNQQVTELNAQNEKLNFDLQQLQSQNNGLTGKINQLNEELVSAPEVVPVPNVVQEAPIVSGFDDSALRGQLAQATNRNQQLERRTAQYKSSIRSLEQENELLKRDNRSATENNVLASTLVAQDVDTIETVETPVSNSSLIAAVDTDANSSAGSLIWPVKYWVFGLMLIGLAVALAVTWAEHMQGRNSTLAISKDLKDSNYDSH